jgi:hypothetical protein
MKQVGETAAESELIPSFAQLMARYVMAVMAARSTADCVPSTGMSTAEAQSNPATAPPGSFCGRNEWPVDPNFNMDVLSRFRIRDPTLELRQSEVDVHVSVDSDAANNPAGAQPILHHDRYVSTLRVHYRNIGVSQRFRCLPERHSESTHGGLEIILLADNWTGL